MSAPVRTRPAAMRGGALLLATAAALSAVAACGSGGPGATASGPPSAAAPLGPYARPAYVTLAETGLFADTTSKTIMPDAMAFEPTYWLWSDGAGKRRWLSLPPGTHIDTSAMDEWVFPIGTKLWKEFSRDGLMLETRLIERYGDGPEDYWMGAFVWNVAQTEAVLAPEGQADVNGTTHDAPAQKQCLACHRGERGRVLGFSALQLSRAPDERRTGPTLADVAARGLLSHAPAGASGALQYVIAGEPGATAAVGYLHANCGHCHNHNGTAWPDTQMVLRVSSHETEGPVESTALYRSLAGQKVQYWRGGAITQRLAPGAPDASAVVARMSVRGSEDQMPPLATENVDSEGVASVIAWIRSLGTAALSPPSP